jgi:hypothetical protein
MRFSGRIPSDLTPNRITAALADLRSRGVPITDLTESNPTRVGLACRDDLLEALADRASLRYEPSPFGLESARTEVAADYRRRGLKVDPAHIILSASTSEAYSLLFKLLCDPGDEVLVPRPSYPLFDHLTRLDSVRARPYLLAYEGAWTVDLDSVRAALTSRTRAIIVVSPNNPTGSFVSAEEIASLSRLSADGGFALIGDEVFADYGLDDPLVVHPSVLAEPLALRRGEAGSGPGARRRQLPRARRAGSRPSSLHVAAGRGRLVGGRAGAGRKIGGGARPRPAGRGSRARASGLLLRFSAGGLRGAEPVARAGGVLRRGREGPGAGRRLKP